MPKISTPDVKNYTRCKPIDDNYILTINLILNRNLTNQELISLKEKCKMNAAYVKNVNELFIKVIGTHKSFFNIFNIKLFEYKKGKKIFYSNETEITLGPEFSYIDDIIGLNNFDYFKHHTLRKIPPLNSTPTKSAEGINTRGLSYFTPLQIASLYNFPTAYNGSGQKIAIIELGGGYNPSDVDIYFQYLNINPKPQIINVSVDGAVNSPDASSASQEVALNVEILGSIANAATLIVYFAPNSFQGFYNAVYSAIIDPRSPSIISISWGAAEVVWGTSYLNIFNNLYAYAAQRGINIVVASGDFGSSDGLYGLNVDNPASSPNVISCGGTSLNSNGSSIQSEVVWSGSGGGTSVVFAKPTYQNNNQIVSNYRCVPDVSACADPYTGYLIYMNNYWYVLGGTSAVAPLISGLIARINQYKGTTCGFINTKLYLNKPVALITTGSNGAYVANPDGRYNLCTGLGRIEGLNILSAL